MGQDCSFFSQYFCPTLIGALHIPSTDLSPIYLCASPLKAYTALLVIQTVEYLKAGRILETVLFLHLGIKYELSDFAVPSS